VRKIKKKPKLVDTHNLVWISLI